MTKRNAAQKLSRVVGSRTLRSWMPAEDTGKPVVATGVTIDIVTNAPGIERTASRVRFEGTGHPERTRRNNAPVVASRPLKKKQTRLAATPTPVHHGSDRHDATTCCTSTGALLILGLIHLFMLVEYYDDEWSKAYCEETGLASWMLGIASTGLGSFPHQLLIVVSLCCISCPTCPTKTADFSSGWPFCWVLLQIVIVLLQIYWFCRGQSARPQVDLARPPTHPQRIHSHTLRRSADPPLALTAPQACSGEPTAATTSRTPTSRAACGRAARPRAMGTSRANLSLGRAAATIACTMLQVCSAPYTARTGSY